MRRGVAADSGTAALANHRRALVYALVLLAAVTVVFLAVGRHPPREAPATTIAFVGNVDRSTYGAIEDARNVVFNGVARALNVIGGGIVTIPLRALVSVWLAFRRRWRAFASWVLTWVAAEVVLYVAKAYFHRGRPAAPLVGTTGFSFPSGHAVAGAATALAMVLVAMPAGRRRRKWEAVALLFAFVMALSRVYLNAHWLSDAVAGVLLGAGVALGATAVATEARDAIVRRRHGPSAPRAGSPAQTSADADSAPRGT